MKVFVILADGEIDQIVEGTAAKSREVRDLRAMGCDVSVKQFSSWADANAYEDKKRGY